jgi:hypothetical protein
MPNEEREHIGEWWRWGPPDKPEWQNSVWTLRMRGDDLVAVDSGGSWNVDHEFPIAVLRRVFEAAGYRLIGPAEAAVLEAMSKVEIVEVSVSGGKTDAYIAFGLSNLDAARAELARRQQPPEKERE